MQKQILFVGLLSILASSTVRAAVTQQITIKPFKFQLHTENFDIERAALAVTCLTADYFSYFSEMDVTKVSDSEYSIALTKSENFAAPTGVSCMVSWSAFTTDRFNTVNRGTSAIYGAAQSALSLSKHDVSSDILKRLAGATLVAQVPEDYGPLKTRFEYVTPSSDFCLRLVGRRYQNPVPNRAWSILSFESEERTMTDGDFIGELERADAKGASTVYYSCNASQKTLTLTMPDPKATSNPSSERITLKATFNERLDVMTINSEPWSQISN